MSGTRFLPPVKVALPEAATGACVVEIDNPRDAVRDPTPENVEDARQAFLQLVCELS